MNGRKLINKIAYEHFALVTITNGHFPIDCLRYDAAMPWKETDARQIEDSMFQLVSLPDGSFVQAVEDHKPYNIVIRKFSEEARPLWMPAKWHSYGGVTFESITPEEAHDINRKREDDPKEVVSRLQFPTFNTGTEKTITVEARELEFKASLPNFAHWECAPSMSECIGKIITGDPKRFGITLVYPENADIRQTCKNIDDRRKELARP